MKGKNSVILSIRVTPDFYQDLMNYCRVKNIKFSDLVRNLLKNKVNSIIETDKSVIRLTGRLAEKEKDV